MSRIPIISITNLTFTRSISEIIKRRQFSLIFLLVYVFMASMSIALVRDVLYDKAFDSEILLQHQILDHWHQQLEQRIDRLAWRLQATGKNTAFERLTHIADIDLAINGIPQRLENEKRHLLSRLLQPEVGFSVVFILLANGDHYLSHPFSVQEELKIYNLSHRPYFQQAKHSKNLVVSDSFIGADGHAAVAMLLPKMSADGSILYYLGGAIHISKITKQFVPKYNQHRQITFLCDSQGMLLASSLASASEGNQLKRLDYRHHPLIAAANKQISKDHQHGINNPRNYQDYRDAMRFFPSPEDNRLSFGSFLKISHGWTLAVYQDHESFLADEFYYVWTFLLKIILLFVAIGIGSFILFAILEAKWRDINRSLYSSKATNQAIIGALPDRLLRINRNGIIQEFIAAADETSVKRQPVKGSSIYQYLPKHLAHRMGSKILQTLSKRNSSTWEFSYPRPNSKMFIEARMSYIGDDEILIILRDVSERHQREMQLHKLSQAVEQSPAAVMITDTRGRIEYVNQKFCQLTQFTKKESIGQNPSLLKSGLIPNQEYDNLWQQILKGQDWRGQMINRRKDGRLYWESASISPLRNKKGQITHFIAVKEDITHLKKIQGQLEKAKKQADNANRAKTEFLANMSHELRTPMNAVLGISQLLAMTNLDDQQREYINIIQSSGDSLLFLINETLDLVKIETGKVTLNRERFCLRDMLEDAIAPFSYITEQKGLFLKSKIDDRLPDFIYADAYRLKQIIFNLIINAVKYTEQGGILVESHLVAYHNNQDQLWFSVSDSGIGISKHDQKRIFNSFTQIDSSLTKKFQGVGLGTTISKKLVELMKGRIEVESPINNKPSEHGGPGSRFSFFIPIEIMSNLPQPLNPDTAQKISQLGKIFPPNGQTSVSSNQQHPAARPLNREQIVALIVEDNPVNQMVLGKILKKLQLEADIAKDGEMALQMMEKKDYNLIFMDLQMPKLDGFGTTEHIRKHYLDRPIVIIAVTAHAFAEHRERCFAVGMNEFISKPFKIDVVEKTINLFCQLQPS